MPPRRKPVTAGADRELRQIAAINILKPPAIFFFARPGARLFVGELGESHEIQSRFVDQTEAAGILIERAGQVH